MNRRRVGNRIRQCRRERRLTEKNLADRSGVSQKVISQLEGGIYKKVTGRLLLLLARALRVRFGALIDD